MHCRTDDYELLASEIQDKNAREVKDYYVYFKKHWKELSGTSSFLPYFHDLIFILSQNTLVLLLVLLKVKQSATNGPI